MSDLTMIAEYIHDAMQAIEKAHTVSTDLQNNTNKKTLDEFRAQMDELADHLTKLQEVLSNEEAYAVDELVDALTKAVTGHHPKYRRTPKMHE